MTSINNSFNFMSWNVGTDGDYLKKQLALEMLDKPKSQEEVDQLMHVIQEVRDKKIKDIFGATKPAVASLQEVSGEPHERVQGWLGSEYAIHRGDKDDTAVAWNKNRFDLVGVIKSEGRGKVTIVDLRDKETAKIIRITSAHVTGVLDPHNPDPMDAKEGDEQLEEIVNAIFKDNNSSLSGMLIGTDLNTTPAYTARYEPLQAQGFKKDNNASETNLNVRQEPDPRQIDHIFSKAMGTNMTISDTNVPDIHELKEWSENPSDHRPLMTKVTFSDSLAGRISRLFGK